MNTYKRHLKDKERLIVDTTLNMNFVSYLVASTIKDNSKNKEDIKASFKNCRLQV